MYLRFEDWSTFTTLLDRKGATHGGKIIKVFATDDDPRITFNKPTLMAVDSNDEPFTAGDVFDFGERGVFTGVDFERTIAERKVNDLAARTARALARFATREDTGFAYIGMQNRLRDGFLIQHPLDGIHGWQRVTDGLEGQEETLHLDIITPISLGRLRGVVDFEDPAMIRTREERSVFDRERMRLRKEQEPI